MKTILTVATLAIALGVAPAFADTGDAPQTSQPVAAANVVVASGAIANDTNVNAYPTFVPRNVAIAEAQPLTNVGTNRIVEPGATHSVSVTVVTAAR